MFKNEGVDVFKTQRKIYTNTWIIGTEGTNEESQATDGNSNDKSVNSKDSNQDEEKNDNIGFFSNSGEKNLKRKREKKEKEVEVDNEKTDHKVDRDDDDDNFAKKRCLKLN